MEQTNKFTLPLHKLDISSVKVAGGKAAALGEIFQAIPDVRMPNGFVITTDAYINFLGKNNLDKEIKYLLSQINDDDIVTVRYLARQIRTLIESSEVPNDIQEDIIKAYSELGKDQIDSYVPVAVRSSAISEDLPSISFAGMFDSYLYISTPQDLINAYRNCCASLYTERAIQYRINNKIDCLADGMAVLVQKMVNSDKGSSGVAFTVDVETNFKNGIVINSVFGLGVGLVQGYVVPDEFLVFKPALEKGNFPILSRKIGMKDKKFSLSPKNQELELVNLSPEQNNSFSLSNETVNLLGQYCLAIENHFSSLNDNFSPMDIEWAFDGENTLWIVQARPLTNYIPKKPSLRIYELKEFSQVLVTGQPVGRKIGQGPVSNLSSPDQMIQFKRGDVLVTDHTDPAWMPIMKKAAAIVTNKGGRTSHAAIVSRELGIPSIVGTKNATNVLKGRKTVTVSCINSEMGQVYDGILDFSVRDFSIEEAPTQTKIMFLTGLPDAALLASNLPNDGVAMGREEFIIYSDIGIHPFSFVRYDEMKHDLETLGAFEQKYSLQGVDDIREVIQAVEKLSVGYHDKVEFFVEKLSEGMAKIAASVYPKEVFMKLCDFKSNEFRSLVGGYLFEPIDNNPMIGWRSAVRYYSERYRPVFELECRAFKRVREEMGFSNMHVMVPFCRTVEEGRNVVKALQQCGVIQHKDGLMITAEIEVPSNVIEAEEFAEVFDMFNIGSNDLAQMVLGTDRDSELLAHIFDERNPAVLKFIKEAIDKIHSVPPKIINGKKVKVLIGLTGAAVSNYPDFARYLIESGIDYIGLDPDPESYLAMRQHILEVERELGIS